LPQLVCIRGIYVDLFVWFLSQSIRRDCLFFLNCHSTGKSLRKNHEPGIVRTDERESTFVLCYPELLCHWSNHPESLRCRSNMAQWIDGEISACGGGNCSIVPYVHCFRPRHIIRSALTDGFHDAFFHGHRCNNPNASVFNRRDALHSRVIAKIADNAPPAFRTMFIFRALFMPTQRCQSLRGSDALRVSQPTPGRGGGGEAQGNENVWLKRKHRNRTDQSDVACLTPARRMKSLLRLLVIDRRGCVNAESLRFGRSAEWRHAVR
jgi:hypothetical protein